MDHLNFINEKETEEDIQVNFWIPQDLHKRIADIHEKLKEKVIREGGKPKFSVTLRRILISGTEQEEKTI